MAGGAGAEVGMADPSLLLPTARVGQTAGPESMCATSRAIT